jgi:hypothetical protein
MTAPTLDGLRPVAVVRSYPELRDCVAAWCTRTEISRLELDERAGLASGHAGKLLSQRPTRRIGIVTLGRIMAALGLTMVICAEGDVSAADASVDASVDASDRKPRQHWRSNKGAAWARRMNGLRALKLSEKERHDIAQQAALARHRRRQQTKDAAP